ncbi:hypothetical protein WHR41_05129 [Cladosporium halotolerans]|uniref:U3 small nucleolar RNA-associated protein 15 C-terminal domain-containing protein n=1 Tax=Cladosporium halotolerans TaxID=1052096 RepID=A0AB34KQ42_9PEZI
MAAEVQPVAPVRAAPGPAPLTADQAYWRTFKSQLLVPSPHNSAITSITIGANDTFAVTSGGRVQIFSSRTRKLIKTISRFGVDDVARSGVLRRDGRIVLAGGESGVIQAFDTGSRAILKQFMREEKRRQAVHVVSWRPDVLTEFMTCSDDRTVKVWDLTEDEPKFTGLGHEDYVRAGCWLPGQEGMLVTGSYDQTVRVWDTRQAGRAVMVFKVAGAVEDVLALSSSTVAVAASNTVSILNLISGKAEVILRSHQKTVTALSLAQNNTRLLTAALDGHVKIHSTTSWEVVASAKYTAPILSLSTVPSTTGDSNDRHLVVGLQTGLLSIKTRLAGAEKVKSREKEQRMQALLAGTADEYERKQRKKDTRQGIRARDRGKDFRGEGADIVITGNERGAKPKKLRPWQQSLRKGAYAHALDLVLTPPDGPDYYSNEDVLTCLTALRHRSALRTALANRSEEQLAPVLEWVLKYINHPRLMSLTTDVALVVLDLYSYKMGGWAEDAAGDEGRRVLSLVERIGKRVRRGCELAQQAEGVIGVLELLGEG